MPYGIHSTSEVLQVMVAQIIKGIEHDGLFWPILLLVDLDMSIIRKLEQTET